MQRVWRPEEESPGLAMSRAFGDYCVKDFGLISVPEVTQRHITNEDQFVVLATDGVRITLLLYRCLETIPGTYFFSKSVNGGNIFCLFFFRCGM